MKEFILFFRMDILTAEAQPTPEQMEGYMVLWTEWIDWISGQGQLAPGGNHLSTGGKVLRRGKASIDGPYAADKESVAGYIVILAKNMDDAIRIAEKCPILQGEGTSVEIRQTEPPGGDHSEA